MAIKLGKATVQPPPPGNPAAPPGNPAPSPTTSEEHRLNLETWFRGGALLLVVVAVVVYPMYALIVRISPATLSQAIAPITGIAGAVVGYWFGQAQRRRDPSTSAATTSRKP